MLVSRDTRLDIFKRKEGSMCIFIWCWWSLGPTSIAWRGILLCILVTVIIILIAFASSHGRFVPQA